ncbi:MAG: ribosome maturation factor RimP [Deltaproteobacteria bacterium]|nr:ribosome maturation factor RimP [Deltaproteobacteria bacterium]
MGTRTKNTALEVAVLVEPILKDMAFELVNSEFVHSSGKWVLRLTIDKEGGVTIDDCARVSRELGDHIDVKELISHSYVFEVSSPGLDRPLKNEKDVFCAVGKKIKVRMNKPIQGRRNYIGYLNDFAEGLLHMKVDEKEVALPWAEVEKANTIYEL